MDNLNAGHRQRLKERFIKDGLEHFEPHNCLELLLFYSIPRRDTNKLAHSLINRFGSLSAVFSASIPELCEVEGISENSAVLITMIPQLMRKMKTDISLGHRLDSTNKVCKYCFDLYLGESVEKLRVICLNEKLEIISNEIISDGNTKSVTANARKIVETAFKNKSDSIILCHNHPGGSEFPSDSDISATRKIKLTLKGINIDLLDHIIVGREAAASMKDMGYLTDF